MISVSGALFLFQFVHHSLAHQQEKTFVKVCEGAQVDLIPIREVKYIEDASICAMICTASDACFIFSYNSAIGGQCNLYDKVLEAITIVFLDYWIIFAIKSKQSKL